MNEPKLYLNPNVEPFHRIKIPFIEKKYGVKYIGTWEYQDLDVPLEVFRLTKPEIVGGFLAERYVGLFVFKREVIAIPCDDLFDNKIIVGVIADDGEVCLSRYPGEHYISQDKTTWVEGGIGHIRTNKLERQVRVLIQDDGSFKFEPLPFFEVSTTPTKFPLFELFTYKWP